MTSDKFAIDRDEIHALLAGIEAGSEREWRAIRRMVWLSTKRALAIDRGEGRMLFEYRPQATIATLCFRMVTILLLLTVLLAIAAVPLLFLDIGAAGALFAVTLGMFGVIALMMTLWLVWILRGPDARGWEVVSGVTGAIVNLTRVPR